MSCDWDIVCREHGAHAGFEWNHGDKALARIVRHRSRLAALNTLVLEFEEHNDWVDIEVQWRCGAHNAPTLFELVKFFAAHSECDVVPKNEYGQWMGDCAQRVACGSCGTVRTCTLPLGHDGECRHEG